MLAEGLFGVASFFAEPFIGGYGVSLMEGNLGAASEFPSMLKIAGESGAGASEIRSVGIDIVGTNFNKVLPTQDYINPLKVEEYKMLLQNPEIKVPWSEAYLQNGKLYLEEGHHRYVARMQLGIDPPLIIRNTGGPIGFPDWSSTTYQLPPLWEY